MLQQGSYRGLVVRDHSRGGIGQAFAARRAGQITSSPQAYLVIPVSSRNFCFVETLQLTIVPFVKGPVTGERYLLLVSRFQDEGQGIDSPLQHRREGVKKGDIPEFCTCGDRFLAAQCRQRDIGLSSEAVL